ncbi:APC family permease [Streptomyces sp. ID05-04B]|uniref:APC family permease n=1 Tax=unclassified Streptomyces TaxID=2593676 RepID=UPI000D19E1C6|nr:MULTISPECIES: APC family permease [unclassified Streptomyces]AVV42978.1 APC family permease [Streptomyces sp. P3]MDX5568199.1 APC family permease [Streptomyces sp. ID05-04B]
MAESGTAGPSPASGRADGTPQRLRGGVLGMADIAAATMANVGPAMSFFFGFAFLATTAGVASPLTIMAAGAAVALFGNTLAEFSRAHPSAGSFTTFVGKTFGPVSAVTTALLAGLGYIIAMASVIAISGGFMQITLNHYTGVDLPWIIWTVLLTGLSVVLMLRGIVVSTKWAGYFFVVEMLVLVVVSVAAVFEHRGDLSAAPFLPSHLTHGVKGLAAGFPLAVYLFIGWENSAALAEETENPRRNVGRAVFSSVAIMTVSYILFAYATVTGFGYDVQRLGDSRIPFIDVAQHTLGALALLAYVGGLTSTLGALIAGINSQARLVFNAGREGLLPSFFGYVHPTRRTPNNAIVTFAATALLIILGWGLGHVLGAEGGQMNPVVFFAESSTLGAILILLVYLASNIALPLYYRRYRPQEFRIVRHVVLPAAGALAVLVPLYYLAKPGQPAPYSWFPYAALATLVAAVCYATLLVRRDPGLADRVGSVVADAE